MGLRRFGQPWNTTSSSRVDARRRRDGLLAAAREATRQMHQASQACAEAVIRLRCFVRGTLGPRNEKLLRYGVKPIRVRAPGRSTCSSGPEFE